MSEFWEAYKHPLWQKKRLEIMEDANFECEECGSKDTTLNVHHRHYRKGAKPWEYSSNELQCLCENCHDQRHETITLLKEVAGQLPPYDLELLLGYAHGLMLQYHAMTEENEPVAIRNAEHETGLTDSYGLHRHTPYSWLIQILHNQGDKAYLATDEILADLEVKQRKGLPILEVSGV